MPPDLLADLKAHRALIAAHIGDGEPRELPEPTGVHCAECLAFVYTHAPQVQQMCHMVMCPYWKAGVGPEWLAAERSKREYRRGQEAA
jgi:hypothetical protein